MINDFNYLKPGSVKEAFEMYAEHDDCKVICGGQSLLIVMRQGMVAPEYLLDIKGLDELRYIKYDEKDGLRIGATTTHREIEKSPIIQEKYPVLSLMETKLASIQTRNWGTIGGNLAHADPAGDPAPVLIALNANIKVGGKNGERTMPLEDFFKDYFETALEKGELVLEVHVPVPPAKTSVAYQKFNLLDSDMGIVAVAASITLNGDDTCKDARIVLGNAAPTPKRVKNAEELLKGKKFDEKLFEEAGRISYEESEPVADIHASEEHRRHLLSVLTKRMIKKAWEQARAVA
ncbi:MAG TPA: xanthine dehydrogenase family protein subunit M [Syntrophorhabdaceae bacterium]|nr:xanthine dehydrogenase family protein subunit M [Syntrophorhabdaceae bacterium]HPC67112.1 xanthine dehydrogenase family protein subunit M [Syntrophorhabdaceae bacterium]HPP41926.1 xanthine dehydrogenase family protein subunit M [Syntrophorhabdaceae bacterium]HQE80488.1 xanthine dehydrogenase family protein subunit M [Syntrophorhabdaceae bacterium]HQH43605.1 xanthine dehydrogenase family protein subunit M [Syntrophorhabdaceae bacterium]